MSGVSNRPVENGSSTTRAATRREAAQREVRGLLLQSSAFQSLPAERQAKVLKDTDGVIGFVADAGGDTALALGGLARAGQPVPAATTLANTRGRGRGQTPFGQAGDDFGNLINKVDFPGFVADLIKGVFNAVVDASIQQMEAYAELVANTMKSVDQYMKDNISEEAGRDYLVGQYPDHLEADLDQGRVVPKTDADEDNAPNFLQDLGLPFDFGDMGDEEAEKELVTAARRKMSMDRQQMLATMVMMGLNRIVVTDGQIKAGVTFNLNVSELAKRHYDRQHSFTQHSESEETKKKSGFWFLKPSTVAKSSSTIDVTTDSNLSQDNERSQEMKVKMTGNVDLRFKSDYFPLERMLELQGMNGEVIEANARRSAPVETTPEAPTAPSVPPPPLPAPR